MNVEFNGIERRLEELSERLATLEAVADKPIGDFRDNVHLRASTERNLQVAAQCVIDICHRIISLENATKPHDYRESILRMAELGVLPRQLAEALAPIASFRNILVHVYLEIDWSIVHQHLQGLDDLKQFLRHVRTYLSSS